MVSLKKTALAVIALGVSGIASAAMYTPAPAPAPACNADSVTVPCERNAWDIGIEALYVQPSAVANVTETGSTDGESLNDLEPKWNWGFLIEGSYHWGTGSDVNLNWTHFTKTTTNSVDSGEGEILAGVDYNGSVTTSVDNKFDEINLEVGQTVNFGEHVDVRFHGGLQFARIEQDLDQTGLNSVASPVSLAGLDDAIENDSKFTGAGPRVGVDGKYKFNNGFSIVSDLATSLLVGTRKINTSFASVDPAGVISPISDSESGSSRQIVPSVEAKLGIRYDHPMSMHGGDCALELGYQVANFWDAIETLPQGQPGEILEFPSQNNSFSYQGVYLKATWIGNV